MKHIRIMILYMQRICNFFHSVQDLLLNHTNLFIRPTAN